MKVLCAVFVCVVTVITYLLAMTEFANMMSARNNEEPLIGIGGMMVATFVLFIIVMNVVRMFTKERP